MITIKTLLESPEDFEDKESFKSFMVEKYAPESCSIRKYNFELMDKYGHCFFYLKFDPPNKGTLYHRYHTQEEYENSIPFRKEQQEVFEKAGLKYEYHRIKDLTYIPNNEYEFLHHSLLIPLDIKIDVDLFEDEILSYNKYFKRWGDKFEEYGRLGLPLVNMNGELNNEPEPAVWPLDRWNFVNLGYQDTPEDFTKFYNDIPDMNLMVNELDFTIPTEVLNINSLKPIEPIKSFLGRSCILKWNSMSHFKPHIDTWKPSPWLRIWGTTNPNGMKLRYKSDGKPNVWNSIKKEHERYEEIVDVEPGRLYLHDSSVWHDAFAFEDDVYQFFISLSPDALQTLGELCTE